jgi:hypothetical protein
MVEHDDIIERVAKALKEPVRTDPDIVNRVMSQIGELPVPGRRVPMYRYIFDWLRQPRTIRLSPLGGLALVGGIAAVVLVGSQLVAPREIAFPTETAAVGAGAEAAVIQFVLVAPGAASVAVVGDFNDWNVSATPLVRSEGDGMWAVTVPLSPGRYRYAFLVNGTTWLKDPHAASAVEDEFGRANSVLTIGGA